MLAGFNLFYFAMISSSKKKRKKGIFSFGPRLFLKCLQHSFPIMLMQGDDVAALQRNVDGEKSTHTKRHIVMETSEVFTWSRWCSFVTVPRMWESPVRRCGIVFWRVLVWHPPFALTALRCMIQPSLCGEDQFHIFPFIFISLLVRIYCCTCSNTGYRVCG